MTAKKDFEKIFNNSLLNTYKSTHDSNKFNELMLETLIIKEDEQQFLNILEILRQLKHKTNYELNVLIDFIEILKYLEIFNVKQNYISDNIYI